MIQTVTGALEKFQNFVGIKFQLYNSLFVSLPFYGVEKTGILLSLFHSNCDEGFANRQSPAQIVENFFKNHTSITAENEKVDLLFRFVQYAERQVVLFDALEDAAFRDVNDMQGAGTLKQLESAVVQSNKRREFAEKLQNFNVRLVLTAHPTQFYPGSVLGIINDLSDALRDNDAATVNMFLQQLGRTPFFKKQKPTPFDEATSLIWYLENIFYHAAGNIVSDLKNSFPANNNDNDIELGSLIKMGFWSGGDRDGNPFVTTEITLAVADALRAAILRSYYGDARELKRRLTFAGVETILAELEQRLYQNIFTPDDGERLTKSEILIALREIRGILIQKHDGLFLHLVDNLIEKTEIFGLFFAALDIRQESSEHTKVLLDIAAQTDALPRDYADLTDAEKINALLNVKKSVDAEIFTNEITRDTLKNIRAVKNIQTNNGAEACERYIISQCQSALNAIEVYGLFLLGGWQSDELTVDIVPLFETIADLQHAASIMRELYENPLYREHLRRRKETQTIMLGFSDGTKDGGYLAANWSIYKAKDELTNLAREYGVNVIFFDGRGGPPARGGGKTHKFYSSMGENIANDAIELTIQGQTVSSNFGTVNAAQFNLEQLLHAGIYNSLFDAKAETFSADEENLMQKLSDEGYRAYEDLKNHDSFLDYLSHASPLRFYAETNIGSRPAKRGAAKKLELKDLRAIPFVGAWSQLKQNVPGYYGVGSALQKIEAEGKLAAVRDLYQTNGFFKTLMDNCEMAMVKSCFPLTAFLADHEIYGELWRKVFDEYELTRKYLLLISGKTELMTDYPVELQSINTRERIVLPLTTIQQYALAQLRTREEKDEPDKLKNAYEKLIMRCSFGIINAGRNAV